MLAKSKIVKGGKISIPATYRKALRLKEGDEIIFNLNNNELTLVPIKTSLQKLREMINQYHDPNTSLVDKLIAERKAEARDD
ncbi:AbrB/MazE/SpoVT family DNA-binding domain-containing protein [Rickettsiales endosymbiont of Peranema trichophorum]|nr:AbrB/MazE/SpoVT family DNA-binding domain-containing protein [Rickettsiales endosymbiont of Peranema trichophorum]